jgi:hypothetical protein
MWKILLQQRLPAKPPSACLLMVGTESYEDITLTQMRKTIARRLSDSKKYGSAFLPHHVHSNG